MYAIHARSLGIDDVERFKRLQFVIGAATGGTIDQSQLIEIMMSITEEYIEKEINGGKELSESLKKVCDNVDVADNIPQALRMYRRMNVK